MQQDPPYRRGDTRQRQPRARGDEQHRSLLSLHCDFIGTYANPLILAGLFRPARRKTLQNKNSTTLPFVLSQGEGQAKLIGRVAHVSRAYAARKSSAS